MELANVRATTAQLKSELFTRRNFADLGSNKRYRTNPLPKGEATTRAQTSSYASRTQGAKIMPSVADRLNSTARARVPSSKRAVSYRMTSGPRFSSALSMGRPNTVIDDSEKVKLDY